MGEADDLLSQAVATISAGGQETLLRPPVFTCSDETHEPFRVMREPVEIGDSQGLRLWGMVRTVGWQFDGDRTDIHDILSLTWGAVLRAFGIASSWLIDEPHIVVPGEIGARHLLFQQCPWKITESNFETARKSLNAWSAFAFHLLDDVFLWERGRFVARPDIAVSRSVYPKWADSVTGYLRKPNDITVSSRTFPHWIYLTSQARGVTVARLPRIRVSLLKGILTPFAPQAAKGEKALVIFANGIPNAIPYHLAKKAHEILWLTGDRCSAPVVLPLDSHSLFIGDKTLVALRGEFGRELFENERQRVMARRFTENRVFFAESSINWRTPLSADALEDMCLDLILREPGVVRAKPVGTVKDRDGGRDILIDWRIPNAHGSHTDNQAVVDTPERNPKGTRIIRVIAQVKSRSKTIGKRDVQDIRDMLEHYEAEGFLLIAYPRVSTALVDHLDKLGKTTVRTGWWESRDIEERLRRHPDIAKRYPRLVDLDVVS